MAKQTLNDDIVKNAVAFCEDETWPGYLTGDDAEKYAEICAMDGHERDRERRVHWPVLLSHAAIEFAAVEAHRAHPGEMVEAVRILATRYILAIRAQLLSELDREGLTMEDAQRWDHEPASPIGEWIARPDAPRAPETFAELFHGEMFADSAIIYHVVYAHVPHCLRALGWGVDDGADALREALDAISDLVSRKWEIESNTTKNAAVHVPIRIETAHISTTKPDVGGLWDIHGNMGFGKSGHAYKTGSAGNVPVCVAVGLDFSEMESDTGLRDAVRRLTPFDRDVFIAATSLQMAGCTENTVAEVYNAMGYGSRPNAAMVADIDNAISKMAVIRIYLDNAAEVAAQFDYPKVVRWASVLPAKGVLLTVRGKRVNGYQWLDRPLLLDFAIGRNQISCLPVAVLNPPYRRSDDVRLLESVLRDHIIGAKNWSMKCRKNTSEYSLSTLLKRCGFENVEPRKRRRLTDYAARYLNYLAECKFIHGWEWRTAKDGGLKIRFHHRAPRGATASTK